MSTRTPHANSLLAIAAITALGSGVGFAQTEVARTDPQTALVAQIAELRAAAGPTAAALIGRLHVLGLLYQEAGDHALAAVALDEARYVTRVHRGLSSIDEALLLMQQIRSEEALGNDEGAWELERDMLTIARKHSGDVRTVPILRDLADDRSEILSKIRAGKFPPELYLGCYYAGPRPRYDDARAEQRAYVDSDSCRFGMRDDVITALREEILMYYADAIETILKNDDYASEELRDLEWRALRVGFFHPYLMVPSVDNAPSGAPRLTPARAQCSVERLDELLAAEPLGSCLQPLIHAEGQVIPNAGNWVSLVRLIAYEIRSGSSASARANAFMELADWHLLSTPADRRHFEESTHRALQIYERAYREFQPGADAQAWMMQSFSPALPVTLPTDERNPFASAADAPPRYIDVAFDVTKYGRGERIEIVATSSGATRGEERDLVRLVESTSFRPRFVDGALADAARVVVRYPLQP